MKPTRCLAVGLVGIGWLCARDLASAATFETLYSFKGGADGAVPVSDVIVLAGQVYGTTFTGGGTGCDGEGCGTVFMVDAKTGVETILHSFTGTPDGSGPRAGLTWYKGLLYGTTSAGGSDADDYGTVFSISPVTHSLTLIHSFDQQNGDGYFPYTDLALYGGELYGGAGTTNLLGEIFKIAPVSGAFDIVYAVPSEMDGFDSSGLTFNSGVIYATAELGGYASGCAIGPLTSGCGTVYSFNPKSGREHTIYEFQTDSASVHDGNMPNFAPIVTKTTIYGTTPVGGIGGNGTVFAIDRVTGAESILYYFKGGTDGSGPEGLVLLNGSLFGVTGGGGVDGDGTVFKIDPSSGAEHVLYSFTGAGGSGPMTGLSVKNGELFGTTFSGGSAGLGTVFKIKP